MSNGYPKYWNRWEGRIVEALCRSRDSVCWDELSIVTDLDPYQLNNALSSLFQDQTISKDEYGNYILVDTQVKQDWQRYLGLLSSNQQNQTPNQAHINHQQNSSQAIVAGSRIVKYLTNWKTMKDLDFSLDNLHFFLDGTYLDELTKDMIKKSERSVLIAVPYVESCYLTEAIIQAREKGIETKIVTRPPSEKEVGFAKKIECHSNLRNAGVVIKYNSQIHSKIVTVDNEIAIVSSMNFYGGSSGGASLEAGIVSIDQKVVGSASKYIGRLFERPDPREQAPNSPFQIKKPYASANVSVKPDINEDRQNLPPRAGQKWTPEEDEELKKGYQDGFTIAQLANKHQRKYGAIRARLAQLGLVNAFFVFGKNRK
jgi:phosphatidylserine/phosphatidylglycerophosphate/cardiolipin synthase-like enzyme